MIQGIGNRLGRVLQPITLYFQTTLFSFLFRLHYLAHALFLTPILPGKIDFNSATELILYDRLFHTDSILYCRGAEKSIELPNTNLLCIICFNVYSFILDTLYLITGFFLNKIKLHVFLFK